MRPNIPVVAPAFVLGLVLVVSMMVWPSTEGPTVTVATTSEPMPFRHDTHPPPTFEPAELIPPMSAKRKTTLQSAHGGAPYPTEELLHALAMCETGGTMDQRATSKSGRYLSFFQWSIETWRAAGGVGDPRDASYEYQVTIVRPWILRTSWASQFPTCSRVIGVA